MTNADDGGPLPIDDAEVALWGRRDRLALSINDDEECPTLEERDDALSAVLEHVTELALLDLRTLRVALLDFQRGRRNRFLFDNAWPQPGSREHDVPLAIEAELRARLGDAWADKRMGVAKKRKPKPKRKLTAKQIHTFAEKGFNGYELFGFDGVFRMRDQVREAWPNVGGLTTDQLRGALFADVRSYRHMGWYPEGDELERLRHLVAVIQAREATPKGSEPALDPEPAAGEAAPPSPPRRSRQKSRKTP